MSTSDEIRKQVKQEIRKQVAPKEVDSQEEKGQKEDSSPKEES